MKSIIVVACLSIATAPSRAMQRGSPANSLPRVLAALAAADANRDGKVGSDEARAIPITAEAFTTQDLDGDGSWSRDEFILYYRRELVAGGQPVGADLEAEVARIQALKRVRVVEEARKLSGGSSESPGDGESVEVRLDRALEELERSAASRKATPEDFQRLRNLVILSGRSATGPRRGSQSSPIQARMLQTLDRIETRARAGQYLKEDFEALRASAAGCPLPSQVVRSEVQTPPEPVPNGRPVGGPAQARRRSPESGGAKPVKPGAVPQPGAKPAPSDRPPRGDGKDESGRSRP